MSTGGWGIIALAMLATTVVGVNPGLMLGISNPGLDYARQVAVPILLKVSHRQPARARALPFT